MRISVINKWSIKPVWKLNILLLLLLIMLFELPLLLDRSQTINWKHALFGLCLVVFYFSICVVHNRMLFTLWFAHGRMWAYWRGTAVVLILGTAVTNLIYQLAEADSNEGLSLIDDFISTSIILVFGAGIYALHRMYYRRFQMMKEEVDSTQQAMKYLQHQVNPHFLFNALNNLYASALHNPELNKELILQLSRILRYQLESVKKSSVPLTEEIAYISDLVSFEKYRIGDRIRVEHGTDADANGQIIAPLLFTPLIENAFKNVVADAHEAWVKINLTLNQSLLTLDISNTFMPRPKTEKPPGMGIGIENLRSRLELYYPQNHQLQYGPDGNIYHVKLSINL